MRHIQLSRLIAAGGAVQSFLGRTHSGLRLASPFIHLRTGLPLLENKRTFGISVNTFCLILFENEKTISQFVEIIKCCDQSGDRVSKNNKSCHSDHNKKQS